MEQGRYVVVLHIYCLSSAHFAFSYQNHSPALLWSFLISSVCSQPSILKYSHQKIKFVPNFDIIIKYCCIVRSCLVHAGNRLESWCQRPPVQHHQTSAKPNQCKTQHSAKPNLCKPKPVQNQTSAKPNQ